MQTLVSKDDFSTETVLFPFSLNSISSMNIFTELSNLTFSEVGHLGSSSFFKGTFPQDPAESWHGPILYSGEGSILVCLQSPPPPLPAYRPIFHFFGRKKNTVQNNRFLTFSGVGHFASSSFLQRLLLSIQPSPGMVSILYSREGSLLVCSYPWSFQADTHRTVLSSSKIGIV